MLGTKIICYELNQKDDAVNSDCQIMRFTEAGL